MDLRQTRIMVCDDEIAGIKVMLHLLSKLGAVNIVHFQDPVAALRYLRTTEVDLAFIDINMPKLDGLNFARQVDTLGTELVFVTAYAEHALASYDVEALDFLTKPVSPERLKTTMDRFLRKKVKDGQRLEARSEPYMRITEAGAVKKVPIHDIQYIQTANKYIVLHCLSENIVWRKTLSQVLTLLPDSFVQIHRSYAINTSWLDKAYCSDGKWQALMLDKTCLPVGKNYRDNLLGKKVEKT